MADLFDEAATRRLEHLAPLAQRLRPGELDRFVGQEHVVGPGRGLRLAIESDRVPSLILYGPPGTGKTTLARIIARVTGSEFVELSAVSATVASVREVLAGARERLGATGRRTTLFLDEIHRFSKAQQDALLPGVEDGLITLIGATTENPYFALTSALLSRMQVYELNALAAAELAEIVGRGADLLGARLEPEAAELIVRRSGGDARSGLSILELAVQRRGGGRPVETRHVEDAARKRPLTYDRDGDAHYDTISAWIKSTRAGDVQASVYYLAVMLEGGEDARFIARRMIILASEDIGNADPRALLVATAAAQAVEHVGLPEARLNLAQAAIYLARAPKSNASYRALLAATAEVREQGRLDPPAALRSATHPGVASLGRGEGYLYPHDDPDGFASTACRRPFAAASITRHRARARRSSASATGRRSPPPGRCAPAARPEPLRAQPQRMRAPSALAASSTASAAVSFARSRIGLTSTSSSESSRPDSETSSSARCASR